MNLTGSPDYGGRVRIVGDPGTGCSSDRYRQFNAAAFQGPLDRQRRARVGHRLPARLLPERARPGDRAQHPAARGSRQLQLRVDMFNAPNQAIITDRNTTMNLASPIDPAR